MHAHRVLLLPSLAIRRRREKRGGVDITYIKNVLLRAFESGGQSCF